MITDRQAKRLWTALTSGKTLAQSADKAGMDEKEAVPILAIVLVLVSGVALFRASYDGALPRLAKRGSLTVLILSVLSILIAIFAEPAQWRGDDLVVSTLTTVLFFPVLAASGFTFWLLGFRSVPSGYRSGKKAVLLVIGSTIAGFLFVTAVFVLLG